MTLRRLQIITALPPSPLKNRGGRPRCKLGAGVHRPITRTFGMEVAVNLDNAARYSLATFASRSDDYQWITVAWNLAPTDRDTADRIAYFLRRLKDFMGRIGAPVVWFYAREYGDKKGDHWHVVAHVPPVHRDQFRTLARGWAMHPVRAKLPKNFILIKDVTDDRGGVPGLVRYCLKDAIEPVRRAYGIRHPATHGPIHGKRLAVSRLIGSTARRAAGWVELPPPGAEIVPLHRRQTIGRPEFLEAVTRDRAA